MKANTLNICLGHIAFPERFRDHVDLMVAPRVIAGGRRLVVVDDSYFGENGSALSEYVQLLWLFEHFDTVVENFEYVRIFQYRRFVSPDEIGRPSAHPWEPRWIRPKEIGRHRGAFSRSSTVELFNRPVELPGGMIGQYADAHVLTDLLNFSRFLIDNDILNSESVARFLSQARLVSACNNGVFHRHTLKEILATLKRASAFVYAPDFVPRTDYQRRSVGFLLERLNSFLILERTRSGLSEPNFGYHILIGDSPVVSRTN